MIGLDCHFLPTLLGSQNAASGSSTTIVLVVMLSSSGGWIVSLNDLQEASILCMFERSQVMSKRCEPNKKKVYESCVWVGKDLCKLYIFWVLGSSKQRHGKSISPNLLGFYRGVDRTRYARWYCSWVQGWAKLGGMDFWVTKSWWFRIPIPKHLDFVLNLVNDIGETTNLNW